MPTFSEMKELINNCSWSWTTQNGVKGYKVTGPNGNSIFLPAAGCRIGTMFTGSSDGRYWSGTLNGANNAYGLNFRSSSRDRDYDYRSSGRTVRPVTDAKDNNSDVDLDGYPEDENWDARRRR